MKKKSLVSAACVIVALIGVAVAAWAWLNFGPLPSGGPAEYHVRGKFGPVAAWSLTPIHAVVLNDGRVMTYGTDHNGRQGGSLLYDVWDPAKGLGPEAHLTLPNNVGTDIFCAGQVLLPAGDGKVLLVGGDRTVNGERNWSSPNINMFNAQKNQLEQFPVKMAQARWYPSLLTLPSGDVMVAGGRVDKTSYTGNVEVYRQDGTWGDLPQARSEAAFGADNWSYPRMWLAPKNQVFVLSVTGDMFYMDMGKGGAVRHVDLPKDLAGQSHVYLPSVMYQPGKILATRKGGKFITVDINGEQPDVRPAQGQSIARLNASMTVLADGDVFLNGGGLRDNSSVWFAMSNRLTQLWSPRTQNWTQGPPNRRTRLYHSISMLLPDATVLTGGGGAPGPQDNLNIEIYYPPYLFKKDGSGQMADRPQIVGAPAVTSWAEQFELTVKAAGISRVTLVRANSVTHTVGFDQRFTDLKWSAGKQAGHLQIEAPKLPHEAPPGYYYLFVIDKMGVPSVAKMIWLRAA
ncbi:MAG: DUF1929 domain-containing protein [Rubrivivax sp.]|nr:MAG: DUF1929 domain-containing protein [Rubrivivax sp.]